MSDVVDDAIEERSPDGPLVRWMAAEGGDRDLAPADLIEIGHGLRKFMLPFQFAINEIVTKIEILRDEFAYLNDYNPIEHISSRVKSPESLLAKAHRRGIPVDPASLQDQLDDIAGVRVTCSFITDAYRLTELLCAQPDVMTLQTKDYIANPKPNGYRGLHTIVETPVNLSTGQIPVKVELQVRTIAMDFWASLEHKIYYKYDKAVPAHLLDELTVAADTANTLDERMQAIRNEIHGTRSDGSS
ncbi:MULTISPECIES: GTP pyrophosphokinase [Mycobacteriales]|uniref:GTP pyrophosphokinase family protein n=1 Tax=Gordonia rubripertincta TaxID=36822 RepID=A0ABT4MVG8_GORRU|nr:MULTISPECIES: GTP pyrophosphokinase family protein [Mycobacteriales]MCZ4550046.1 GTP pyrophosphokinase family protein [Gordonia rubripertincta]